jgi:hypothetical protein
MYCEYTKGSVLEIQTPVHRNLIGRSMTAPPSCVIAQQYSSASYISLHFYSHWEKFGQCKLLHLFLFSFLIA